MATGLEALGAASAVLQVISFASDLVVACKNAYDGATTPQDDLERHSKQIFEAVGRVHARCERMATVNSRFADPELQNIAKDCKDAAKSLQAEVQSVTSMQAKGNILKSIRKAFKTSRHQRKLQVLEDSLSRHQELIRTELTSHLCSQSDAVSLQQDRSFHKLDSDVQLLVNQLAQGVFEVTELVREEHTTTRTAFAQETAKAEKAINTHTDAQMLDLRTTTEMKQQCETFLKSLKAERMNQRYTNIIEPEEASFNQVFASYEDILTMYFEDSDDYESEERDYLESEQSPDSGDSENDDDSGGSDYPQHRQHTEDEDEENDNDDLQDNSDSEVYRSSESSSNLSHTSHVDDIWLSWDSFISWLQSDEKLFYIAGKPGSGKSALVKFITNHHRTRELIQERNPDAIIIRYFFWKIGSHEENSIKGLWCSLLYQRLERQSSLIQDILHYFQYLSSHTSYHDWTIKDLQAAWEYINKHDDRHLYIFIDGLDEIRNEDGFPKLLQSIRLLSKLSRTKLCVSTRPEAQITRWLEKSGDCGFRLEDLTKHDMIVFVRNKLRPLLPDKSELSRRLHKDLVKKSQGVFLWLHLATNSLIEGIANNDPKDMLLRRLSELPADLEALYTDMWERLNANNSVYRQTAARYLRYALLRSPESIDFRWNALNHLTQSPFAFQIVCAEKHAIQRSLLAGWTTMKTAEILQVCEEIKPLISTRCAGLLELQPVYLGVRGDDAISNAFAEVVFIHRTAHDFLVDTEAGRRILENDCSSDSSLHTGLLKGLICSMVASSSEWGISWQLADVINEITQFTKTWGSSSLEVAFEFLDVIRSLYDKARIKTYDDGEEFRRPFFSFLTYNDFFDDFVIQRLEAANSVQMSTDTLRDAWIPRTQKTLSTRLFNTLLCLGADPHKYGVSYYNTRDGPFVSKISAFTQLLVSFYLSREGDSPVQFPFEWGTPLCKQDLSDIIAMALRMARSCDSLDTRVAFYAPFSENRSMEMALLWLLPWDIRKLDPSSTRYIVYEINLHFLLLYLLSRAGGDTPESVLGCLEAEDLLLKVNNPWIMMRYFLLPETDQLLPNNSIPIRCHRISSQASYLPKHLVEHFLRASIHTSTGDHLFKVGLKRRPDGMDVMYDTRSDLGTVIHHIKNSETVEVDFETMMTTLADENPDIFTHEEVGIVHSASYLRQKRERNLPSWSWCPLLMDHLEAAAASREARGSDEDLPL